MTDSEAESARVSLIRILDQAEELLVRFRVAHWGAFIGQCRKLIEDRDFRGIEALWGSFGGMGSFNDVVIHPLNGNPISESDVANVNNQLNSLHGDLFDLATALRRYHNGIN